jgi:hypothetical protein
MTVNDRIRAVHILQRFVMMSRSLLPSFSELMCKDNLTKSEKTKLSRIRDVYDTFRANPEMSIVLVNSNIFQLIMDVYNTTIQSSGETPQSLYVYDEFLRESDRLIDTWNRHQLN